MTVQLILIIFGWLFLFVSVVLYAKDGHQMPDADIFFTLFILSIIFIGIGFEIIPIGVNLDITLNEFIDLYMGLPE